MMCALLTNNTESKIWAEPFPCQMRPRTKIMVVSTQEEIDYYYDALVYKPEPKPTCVYLMLDDRTGLFKIGSSKRPEYRERTLQSDNPMVTLLAYWIADEADEKALHKHFDRWRVRGEWFKLNSTGIRYIGTYFERSPDIVGSDVYMEIITRELC